jgi:Ca2+-binding RTX toxin-like protein
VTVINTIDPTASIAAANANQTIVLAPGFQRVMMTTAFAGTAFVNFGTLIAPTNGVDFSAVAAGGQFTNKAGGLVSADLAAVKTSASCDIVNEGTLLSASSHGIAFQTGANNCSVINRGDIYGAFGGIAALAPGMLNLSITNSGEIRSDLNGIWLNGAVGAAPVVVNSGVITGRTNATLAENGDRLDVTNTGKLIGNVTGKSAGQQDKVANSGTITGNVLLGSGNDSYAGNGSVSGMVSGEAGNDLLTGGRFIDRMNGGSENDRLSGLAGKDELDGGAGNDRLTGGIGADKLTGGLNADRFEFLAVADSRTAGGRDTIVDFSRSQGDRIVLSAIDASTTLGGNQAFKFIGTAAFTGAAGELRYQKSGGNSNIYADTNGDGVADMQIISDVALSFVKGDFVL